MWLEFQCIGQWKSSEDPLMTFCDRRAFLVSIAKPLGTVCAFQILGMIMVTELTVTHESDILTAVDTLGPIFVPIFFQMEAAFFFFKRNDFSVL